MAPNDDLQRQIDSLSERIASLREGQGALLRTITDLGYLVEAKLLDPSTTPKPLRQEPAKEDREVTCDVPPYVRPIPDYDGTQDPAIFLRQMEDYCNAARVPAEDISRVVLARFKGNVADWARAFGELGLEWPRLRSHILSRFKKQGGKDAARAELLTKKQTAHETTSAFLVRKQQLVEETGPLEDEVYILSSLLRDPIQERMWQRRVASLGEMIEFAFELERTGRDRPPPVSTERPKPTPTTQPEGGPPQCRYCPERHWHRSCPVRARKAKPSGNE